MLQQVIVFYSNAVVKECADAYYRAFKHLGMDTIRVNKDTFQRYENDVDLVLVIWGYEFLEEHFTFYKRAKIALFLMDEPYEVDHTKIISRNYDFVFNYEQTTVPLHQNCYYLPFAYDSLGLEEITRDSIPPEYDVCFWGSNFPPRKWLLAPLRNNSTLRTSIRLGFHLKDRQPYRNYYTAAKRARINLNIHRQSASRDYPHCSNMNNFQATGLNMRFWNLAGIGAFQLNYANREEHRHYPFVITFKNSQDLMNLIEYFLENEQEWQYLALKLQKKILAHHTYIHRAREIVRIIESDDPIHSQNLNRSAFSLIQRLFAQYTDKDVPA